MNLRNVTIIPPTNSNQPNLYLGTPGKIHVVGYARVIKGAGAGVQIRKNIRRLISDQPKWELTFVRTDYRQTENQDLTWRSFFNICNGIRCRYIDVLIIHSDNDMEEALSIAEWLLPFCKSYGVLAYIAHNDLLLPECNELSCERWFHPRYDEYYCGVTFPVELVQIALLK